jgi:Na+-driven multidrug efflux pump
MGFTKVCIGMAMSAAVGLSIILSFAGPYIYKLFTRDPLVIEKAMDILHFLVPTFCALAIIHTVL